MTHLLPPLPWPTHLLMLMSAVVILLRFLLGMHPGTSFLALGMPRHYLLGLMLKHLHLLAGHCHHRHSPDSSACQQLPAPSDLQNSHNRLARQPAEETVQHSVPHAVYDCSTPHLWFLSSAAVATGLTSIPNIMQKQAESAAALAPVLCLIRWLSRLRLGLVSTPVLHLRRLRLASVSASVHAFLAMT